MVTLTPGALAEVKRLMAQQSQPSQALRVGVQGGGCSGLNYVMGIDSAEPKQFDQAFEVEGVNILVDTKSHLYLDGTTIDYVSSMTGGGFQFSNPNAKKSCGCGTSFSA